MGYYEALRGRAQKIESKSLGKKAAKKSLWGSIGRTAGGLLAMGLTGGLVNPLTLGLITGAASFAGGAIGAKASGGKLTEGKFFKSEREDLQGELGAFGTQNITESLKSGVTAGIGQKLKLMKLGDKAAKLSDPGLGMDFEGSMLGKGLPKIKSSVANLRGNISTGFENKTMDWSTLPEGMSPRDYQTLVGERQASYAASERFANQPSIIMKGGAPDFTGVGGKFQDPGQYEESDKYFGEWTRESMGFGGYGGSAWDRLERGR